MASGSDIRAGGAFVEMYMQDNELTRGLDAVGAKLKAFGGNVMALGGGIMAAGLSILAPLAVAVNEAIEAGSEMQDFADRTGETVETLSRLKHAAEQSGAGMEDLEAGIRKLQQQLGSGAIDEDLQKIGMSADQLKGMTADQQFLAIADAIKDAGDESARTEMAMKLLGKSGYKLKGLFKDGADGVRELLDEADRLSITMSGEDASAAEAFGDELANIEKMTKAATQQIGFALIPVLSDLVKPLVEAISMATRFVKENREMAVTVAAVGVGLVAAGGIIVGLGAAIAAAGFALTGLSAAIGFAGTVLAALVSPVGLVVGGIAALAVGLGALAYAWMEATESGQAFKSWASDAFGQIGDDFQKIWGGIIAAVKAGRLELAFKIAWKGIQLEADRALGAVTDIFWSAINQMLSGITKLVNESIRQLSRLSQIMPGMKFIAGLMGNASMPEMSYQSDFGSRQRVRKLEAEINQLLAEANQRGPEQIGMPKKVIAAIQKSAVLGLAEAAKGTSSSYAIQQSLSTNDSIIKKVEKNTDETAKTLKQIKQQIEVSSLGTGLEFA